MSRLHWKCRRGMLELDLLLRGFLDSGYGELDEAGKAEFEALLELPDQELFELLLEGEGRLVEAIRNKFTLGAAKKD